MIKIIKLRNSNNGVSEVVGTILLLGIAVAIFSVLYIIVLSEPFGASEQYPTVVTFVEGDYIIVEHRGGDELSVDNYFKFEIFGTTENVYIDDNLDDVNSDDKWNIGERLRIYIGGGWENFDYSLEDFNANVTGTNDDETETILKGSLDIYPQSDVGVEITVDNQNPNIGDTINIMITVRNFRGDVNASGIKINYVVPKGLEYKGHTPSSYSYSDDTGIWHIEQEIPVRGSISLTIQAKVVGVGESYEPTQVIMVLDGSGSIGSGDWNLMRKGLANAVTDIFPKDGSAELTVIQFGGRSPIARNDSVRLPYWPYSQRAYGFEPVTVTETNNHSINQTIRDLYQMEGWTPMSCGLRLAADAAFNSINFSANKRQIVFLVTDGIPNCVWSGTDYYGNPSSESEGENDTVLAAEYLIEHLQMTEDKDQFNALAVGNEPKISWLRGDYGTIVWPEPGTIAPPYDNPGWVTKIDSYSQFETAIKQIFRTIFENIKNEVILVGLDPVDPNNDNDNDDILIILQ